MTIDELIARARKASENQCMSDLCRENFKQLAEWLEELKQYKEENQPETNLDYFQQEILEKGLWNLAVVKGRPERCDHIKCIDCELSKDRSRGCHEKVMNWLKQPRKDPAIKLTKFEYDLLQSIKHDYKFKKMYLLRELKEKGHFQNVNDDDFIKDLLANYEIVEEKED